MNRQLNIWRALLLEQYVQDIISDQEDNGWQFNVQKANEYITYLEKESARLYNHIRPHLCFNVVAPYKDSVRKPFKISGEPTQAVVSWWGDSVHLVAGQHTRVRFDEPNLDSDKQLKEQLFKLGWVPDEWNYKKDKKKRIIYEHGQPIKTSPKLTESSYKSLTVGIGPDVALYLKVSMRLSSIKGWLSQVRDDGTISARANPLGTPTARFRHAGVVNVPKAKPEVFFGKECRSLFTHRPGRKLVGHDAAGLESRMEAHWTYNISKEYSHEILHGDVHQKNADRWGVVRDKAKNGKYAVTYGAYPPRLAATLGISKKKAQEIFDDFWSDDNPLNILDRRLKKQWKRWGYLIALDGRPMFVRKESDRINTTFQGSGSIVMKVSLYILSEWVKKYNIDAIKVGDFHDEAQADVALKDVELYGNLAVQSIRKAGQVLKLNIPLDADYKAGEDWSETH